MSEQVNVGSPPRNTILQLSTPTPTLYPQTSHLLNHRRWCHLANKLKLYCKQRTAENSTSGIAAIGSSAIAGLLVWYAGTVEFVRRTWRWSKKSTIFGVSWASHALKCTTSRRHLEYTARTRRTFERPPTRWPWPRRPTRTPWCSWSSRRSPRSWNYRRPRSCDFAAS